jgi:hypothetical protein
MLTPCFEVAGIVNGKTTGGNRLGILKNYKDLPNI